MSQIFVLFFDLWHNYMTQILMQNMTVRSWLVMTNNFEHKGKNNFQIKKTNRWMGKNSKTLFCKFIARGWKWNVHESVSNDIQINFFNNHHYWNYLYLWRDLTMTNVWQYANKWKYIAIWMRFQDKHIKSAVPQTLYYPLASFSL